MGSLTTLTRKQTQLVAGLIIGLLLFLTYLFNVGSKTDDPVIKNFVLCQTSINRAQSSETALIDTASCKSLFKLVAEDERLLPGYIKIEDVYTLDAQMREIQPDLAALSTITDGRMFKLPSGKYSKVQTNWAVSFRKVNIDL